MWEHYRKTFLRMQIFIILATVGLYQLLGRRLVMAAMFYAFMQLGALIGAWWGDRLRRRLRPQY